MVDPRLGKVKIVLVKVYMWLYLILPENKFKEYFFFHFE